MPPGWMVFGLLWKNINVDVVIYGEISFWGEN
jgi:hypothetical protein